MENAKVKTISKALDLLDRAAKEESEEIANMISEDYQTLKNTITTIKPTVDKTLKKAGEVSKEKLLEVRDSAAKLVRETSETVDKKAHESPWYFVGGAALLGAALGLYVSSRSKGDNSKTENHS